MTFSAGQQPCARRSSAARLSGVRYCRFPFGKISMCPTGSKIEPANETAISKIKSDAIGILILKTAKDDVRMLSMVNDHSYWSLSIERSVAENSKRKRPLFGTAAERWEVSTSRGKDTIGRNNRVLREMVRPPCARYHSECQADMRQAHPSCLQTTALEFVRKEAWTSAKGRHPLSAVSGQTTNLLELNRSSAAMRRQPRFHYGHK
jgi:hypothetical protein